VLVELAAARPGKLTRKQRRLAYLIGGVLGTGAATALLYLVLA
jgi:hypothetical protein